MPEIRPFRGILYNPARVNLSEVVAPPYDVISPRLQAELCGRSPYNCIRLILNGDEDPYTSAANHLDRWLHDGILRPDPTPCLYFITQNFHYEAGGIDVERKGFIAACALEDLGSHHIFPHERTLATPKEDRFRLFQATGMMFSQVFGLYSDPRQGLADIYRQMGAASPDVDFVAEGMRNRLWRVRDHALVAAVTEFIAEARILVADGHHRYETALVYRDSQRLKNRSHTGKEAYNFVPMYFTDMHDPGLVILPTHRIVHSIPSFSPAQLLTVLRERFNVYQVDDQSALLQRLSEVRSRAFGLVVPSAPHFHMIEAPPPTRGRGDVIDEIVANLDVSVLHASIFRDILGMSEESQMRKENLHYEKDPIRSVEQVMSGSGQAAFLMNPTNIDDVRAVAEGGAVLPQKSTYFHPKLLSGVVSYSFGGFV